MKKISYELVKASFEKEGYTLLTKTYENNRQKLEYICKMGHHHSITWTNWNSSQKVRCPYCNGRPIITIEIVRQAMAEEGYILLTEIYENNNQKLEYICKRGHQHMIIWAQWNSKRKPRCPYCAGLGKPTIEFIRAKFAEEGYILLTKVYKNSKQKLECICSRGHGWAVSWNNWSSKKRRCPKCNNNHVSKWEKTVKEFLTKLNINYVPNDRTQLVNPNTGCNLELDVWLPQLNKAIECNGVYWHKDRQHIGLLKRQLCKDQGIDLLIITDKEWNDGINKCKKKIQDFLLVCPFISTKEIKKETEIKNEQ